MRIEYFQLIDRVVAIDIPGRAISVEAIVPTESTIFEGHFPGYPLMPGVLLVECMAQTAGWLVTATQNFRRMPFLAQVKEAKFRTFVAPGSQLLATAKLVHEGSGYAMTEARITHEGKPVCDADITFRVLEFPNEKFAEQMRATARRIGLDVKEALADG
jgi:3-hydroxyacyl-[acyl-carrier-protein] dehydratase